MYVAAIVLSFMLCLHHPNPPEDTEMPFLAKDKGNGRCLHHPNPPEDTEIGLTK